MPNVVFDGWNEPLLHKAAEGLGWNPLEADRLFPGGVMEALNLWTKDADDQLARVLTEEYNLESMKIRERIATAVMVKLRALAPHREAVRKAMAIYQMPWHSKDALKSLYYTVDTMWRAAGDTSTDWNFYSKRLLLAKVYTSAVLVWLNDETEDLSETEAFLYRRIENVMQIQKLKAKANQFRGRWFGSSQRA